MYIGHVRILMLYYRTFITYIQNKHASFDRTEFY